MPKLTHTSIKKFLADTAVMNLAVIGSKGPISSVMIFTLDSNFNFYGATRRSSFKALALKNDNRISFSVWQHRQMLIQANGIAEEVTDPKEVSLIIDKLIRSVDKVGDFWPPIVRAGDKDYVIYKIVPFWIRALNLEDPKVAFTENHFYEIKIKK